MWFETWVLPPGINRLEAKATNRQTRCPFFDHTCEWRNYSEHLIIKVLWKPSANASNLHGTLISTYTQRELLFILLWKFYNTWLSTVFILLFPKLFSSVTSVAFFEHIPEKNFISIFEVSILIFLSNEMNVQSLFWIVYPVLDR